MSWVLAGEVSVWWYGQIVESHIAGVLQFTRIHQENIIWQDSVLHPEETSIPLSSLFPCILYNSFKEFRNLPLQMTHAKEEKWPISKNLAQQVHKRLFLLQVKPHRAIGHIRG